MTQSADSVTRRTRRIASRDRSTLADVARLAGVSSSVAGLVLNGGQGNTRCGPKTAEIVRQAARQLGYHPNHAARLLCGKRSHTIGLLVASAGDPLRSFLVEYLDTEVVKIGCHTMIGNTVISPSQFDYYIEEFARRGVDGVLCAVHHWFDVDRAGLLAHHPNTVFYEDPNVPGAAYVAVDRQAAMRLAVRHLAERGRRRIGLAVMTLSETTHLDRLQGYRSELAALGLPRDEKLVFNAEDFGPIVTRCDGVEHKWRFPGEVMGLVVDRLVRDHGADAIIAHDDFWAATLIKTLRARGVRVPADVSVVGYLNHYLTDWTDPALTTIDMQNEMAANAMVSMMQRMIHSGPLPEQERIQRVKPTLVVRDST
jgi:DNA-binding LacI/PurR family transcriptional regulator